MRVRIRMMSVMERSRYGEERRVKRVRISSSAYLSQDDEEHESCSDALNSIPYKNNTAACTVAVVAERSVEGMQVAKLKKVARKEQIVVKEKKVKAGSAKVVWRESSTAMTYSLTLCEECEGGNAAEEMLLCDKCDRGFHMFCLSPILVTVPPGDWICPNCSQSATAYEFEMVQKKIVDYFSLRKFLPWKSAVKRMGLKKQRRRLSSRARLLPYVPTKDMQRRLEQMASLAAALASLGIKFSDSLSYGYAPRTANRAAHEKGGMREIPKKDKETLLRCKAMCKRGEWQPLMVTYDLRQGFVVEADEDIKDMTFIAEYTGEVDYMCCRHYDSGNSIMGLLFSDDPVKELVVCPDRKGNIARFLSGINNHTKEGKGKQNVRCVRYRINGEARVVLSAMRDILKGERLYYDYNAYYTEYPTQHFV